MSKTENILIRINADLKERFKRLCDLRKETMSENIESHIRSQIGEKEANK